MNVYENPAVARAYVKRAKLTYPIALDADNAVAEAYGVHEIPAVFLIDKRGALRYKFWQLPSMAQIEKAMK